MTRPPSEGGPRPDVLRDRLRIILHDKMEFLKSAKRSFKLFDQNHSNTLEYNEIKKLVARLCCNLTLPPIDDATLKPIFKKYDVEQDGYLTLEEFVQFYWRLLWRVQEKYYPPRDVNVKREYFVGRFSIQHSEGIRGMFEFKRLVGAGSFGQVHLVVERCSQLLRTCKTINKKQAAVPLEQIEAEITVLKSLDHPNVIKIYDVYEDDESVYIIQEYCQGGELLERVINAQNRGKTLNERYVCSLVHQIFKALHYFHERKVLHKDLKPENVLFLDASPNSLIKVIDFGLAEIFHTQQTGGGSGDGSEYSHNAAGTVLYMAPEVFQRRLHLKCDVWSAGCIMFLLLTGHLPFTGHSIHEIRAKQLREHPNYQLYCSHLSEQAVNLIKRCLDKNIRTRPSAAEVLRDPWFQLHGFSTTTTTPSRLSTAGSASRETSLMKQPTPSSSPPKGGELSAAIRDNLKRFIRQSEIKLALINLMAHQLDLNSPQVQEINALFNAFDLDQNGTLSVEELRFGLARQKRYPLHPWEINLIIQALDVDNNGHISYTEFLAATYSWRYSEINLVWSAFNKLDTDGDGRVLTSHLTNFLLGVTPFDADIDINQSGLDPQRYAKLKQAVDAIDVNGDGMIDWEEFTSYITSR